MDLYLIRHADAVPAEPKGDDLIRPGAHRPTHKASLRFSCGEMKGRLFGAMKSAGTYTGATPILFSGTVTPNITLGSGVTPQLSTATTIWLCRNSLILQ